MPLRARQGLKLKPGTSKNDRRGHRTALWPAASSPRSRSVQQFWLPRILRD
jgi:hypothetical protein